MAPTRALGLAAASLMLALAPAASASADGKRVIVADEQTEWGGSLPEGGEAVQQAVAVLRSRPNVTLLGRATVFGIFGHNHAGVLELVPPASGRA